MQGQALPGFRDFYPDELALKNHIFATWREVARRYGPPQIRFHAGAAERFKAMGGTSSLLTLTHSRDLAIAHVILLRE